jgi:hypothetical protein
MDMSLKYLSVLEVRIPEDRIGLPKMLSMVLGEFEELHETSLDLSCLVISSFVLALVRPELHSSL